MSVESDLISSLGHSFVPIAINKIGIGVKTALHEEGFKTTPLTRVQEENDSSCFFYVKNGDSEEVFCAKVEIHFVRRPKDMSQGKGFYIDIAGDLKFFNTVLFDSWHEPFPELQEKSCYKDFINLIENFYPVDFCVSKIVCFYESLKEKSNGQH